MVSNQEGMWVDGHRLVGRFEVQKVKKKKESTVRFICAITYNSIGYSKKIIERRILLLKI